MSKTYPKLTLVGAGPGDPELITMKGVKALAKADVVLYDSLVDPELLQYAPRAEHILVGKRAGRASVSQDTINKLIVEKALNNGHVVRLKGGDPFVFARGGEEMEYAQQFGIETNAIIGVSSIMIPGYFGIPLTYRGINQSFTVVTATTSKGLLSDEVVQAAQHSPTTIIFMGLRKLDLIVAAYQQAGRGDLPVAVISQGTMNEGQVVCGTVDDIYSKVLEAKPASPALLIFGEGAAKALNPNMETILESEKEFA